MNVSVMKIRGNYLFSASVVFVILMLLVVVTQSSPRNSSTVSAESCQAGMAIVQPFQNQQINGIVPIELGGVSGVSSVKFLTNGMVIGRGLQEPNSGFQWRMIWDSGYSNPGETYALTARVQFGTGGICETSPVIVNVQNGFKKPLEADLLPPFWSGLTNSTAFFNVNYLESTTTGTNEIAKYADVVWSVSGRGSVTPQPSSTARYWSGPQAGNGTVRAVISYGGGQITREATTEVIAQYVATSSNDGYIENNTTISPTNNNTTTTTNTTNINNTTTSTDDTTKTTSPLQTSTEPAKAITQILNQDSYTKACIQNILGEDVLKKLVEENRRPNKEEYSRYLTCFARQNYVLPSILAPVAPEEVTQKPESRKVIVNNIANSKIVRTEDNAEQIVLVLGGTAEPNSNVILYVFSEPLVLATTADNDGNWSYSLEDPLPSGEHEVYALVDKGDGEYERSSVASFVIGTAEASDENPNGYSLQIISEPTITASNRSINIFVVASIFIVTFAGVVVGGLLIIRTRFNNSLIQNDMISPDTNSEDSNYSNFTKSL